MLGMCADSLPWAVLAAVVAFAAGWKGIAAAYLLAYLILRIGMAWAAGVWGLRDRNHRREAVVAAAARSDQRGSVGDGIFFGPDSMERIGIPREEWAVDSGCRA